MPEEDIIRALDKMICDREELLRHVANSAIREEADALRALRAEYCSVLDLESEYKIMQKKYKHREDEVNELRCELANLHKELDEAKKPKPCHEVLFSDGSSVCVENAASWDYGDHFAFIRDKDGYNVALFSYTDLRGIIKRGKRENDEDDESTRRAGA